jgi:hypothetical protein
VDLGTPRALSGATMTETINDVPLLVLLDALEQYYRHLSATDGPERDLFEAVERWFATRDPNDPRGFEGICAALRLDAHRIRTTLMRRRAEAVHLPFPPVARKKG